MTAKSQNPKIQKQAIHFSTFAQKEIYAKSDDTRIV